MTPEEKLAWDELVELCCAGVLAKVDRVIVEQGACLLVRLRACHYNIDPKYMIRMEHVLACLGMTPADRSRVKVPKGTKPKSPYDE